MAITSTRLSPEAQYESDLTLEMGMCSKSFERFVYVAFPWGSGELADFEGPDEWQSRVIRAVDEGLIDLSQAIQIAVASGHGVGKAQPKSLELLTPNGRMSFGDLNVGDSVFACDGSPTDVVAIHQQGVKRVYKVTFDDGSSTRVCGEHVWTVRGRAQRRVDRKGGKSGQWINMTTEEILRAGAKRKNGASWARQWEIPTCSSVEIGKKDTPIDPYLLGVWLGDGGREAGVITSPDPEIIDAFKSEGYSVSTNRKTKEGIENKALAIYPLGFRVQLRELGVLSLYSYERYVPDLYKDNDASVRSEILAGLLDTDAEVNSHGSVVYASTSKQLAEDVIWLTRSLGGKARMAKKPKDAWYPGEDGERINCRPCYIAYVTLPHGLNPLRVGKKRERLHDVEDRYLTRWIDSIEPEDEHEDCMCITVADANGLYLTNDFIVTHNSSLVSWAVLWSLSTFEDTKGVVTANTETQLRTKTWAEIGKWFRMLICKHWFKMTATAIFSAQPGRDRTWRVDMVPWSENNMEAFAGLHNQGKRLLLVFDEASAIPDKIWETSEGALTDKDTEILWLAFGNPTRNTGRFKECFGRFRHRWHQEQVDSRTVAITNKEQLNQWVDDYGEDSDFVRVRVRGVFPRAGDAQFISSELVEQATARHLEAHIDKTQPLILGVDVARFGDDQTVLLLRQGRVVRRIWRYRGEDTHQTAMRVEDCMRQWEPDAVFIDGGGPGAGVVDILRSMNKTVIEVTFGAKARDPHHYINKRVEMWDDMRQWLKTGAIPDDRELHDDLIGPEYGFAREGVLRLEKKEDMKKRGLASPDAGDALACSFAEHVLQKKFKELRNPKKGPRSRSGYNPLQFGR